MLKHTYAKFIHEAINNNREQLVRTLYLMYAQGVTLSEVTCRKLNGDEPGYTNEARRVVDTYWNKKRIKKYVGRYVLQLGVNVRIFSRVSWYELPSELTHGPFGSVTADWVNDNVTIISNPIEPLPVPDIQTVMDVLDHFDKIKEHIC